jgi:hypothetical protein
MLTPVCPLDFGEVSLLSAQKRTSRQSITTSDFDPKATSQAQFDFSGGTEMRRCNIALAFCGVHRPACVLIDVNTQSLIASLPKVSAPESFE